MTPKASKKWHSGFITFTFEVEHS